MLNLIKMDLRRLTRMKSFWIMIAVAVLLAGFGVFMTDYTRSLVSDIPTDSDEFFASITSQPWMSGRLDFTDLVNIDATALNLTLLCAIFVPIFVNGEQKNGYIKNIAGQLPNRGMLVLSKLVTAAVQVFVIFAMYFLSMAIAGKIFLSEDLYFSSFGTLAKTIGIHYLLHVGFASVIMALTIMIRSSGLGMTIGIICSTPLTATLYKLINIPLHKCGIPKSFDIGDYAVEKCIQTVKPNMAGGDLVRVIVVGIAFLVVFTGTAMVVMQKRDIK